MLKKLTIILLSISPCCQGIWGQKEILNQFSNIDNTVNLIPDSLTKSTLGIANYIISNFDNENDRVRAVFSWIAYNVEYDIEDMFIIDIYEKKVDKISKILRTKKGTCDHYSLLFNEICSQIGIRSYIVDGYTKQNNLVDNLPHSWCVAQIDKEWYIFDPTWGAGAVANNKFIRKINNSYFKVKPSSMIKSHMPFDYLWQLLEYPINTEDFYANKIEQSSDKKSYFNYPDSINAYDSQLENERLICSGNRIEKNGIKNLMTAEYLKYLKLEIENNERSQISTQFNQAMSDYNKGAKDLNDFVNYRNNKFSPSKSDSEIQNMMNLILSKFNDAKTRLLNIQTRDISINDQILASIISIEDAMKVADEQNSWLATYLKKGKLARKSMFYKVSWFGIPLN